MTTATEQFSSTAKNAEVRAFSAQVRQMQSDLATMSKAQRVSQLGFSSIEDAYVPVFDALGQARMFFGRHNDGTYALTYVDGPPPPKPNQPIVGAREGGVAVAIDGTFVSGYTRPADVARFDIHMSPTPGFQHDGTTIVGDVTDAGVRVISAANVTQYVKVVAVSRAKDSTTGGLIASAPTDEIAVLPLPISQIAVGAIGAQQFAADIGFVSRLLVGNPNAGHLEFEGRAGMTPGLHAYDGGLNPTFDLDGLTGSVTMRGTLRSADTGERLVWREYSWLNSIRAYPKTGDRFAQLYANTITESGTDYGAFLLAGPPSTTGAKQASFVWVTHNDIQLYRTKQGGVDSGGLVFVNDDGFSATHKSSAGADLGSLNVYSSGVRMTSGATSASVWPAEIYLYAASTNFIDVWLNRVDVRAGAHQWRFSTNTPGNPLLWTTTTNCGIEFNTTGIDIFNPSTGAYLYIGAVDISKKTSSRETKTEIEELPFDPERAIVNAPSQQYEYLRDQRDRRGRYQKARKQIGPMAEDMPAQLVSPPDSNGDVGLFMFNTLGVVWAASAQQTMRLDDLTARLEALEAA